MSTRRQRIARVILVPLAAVAGYFGAFFILWKGFGYQAGEAFASAAPIEAITVVVGGLLGIILFTLFGEVMEYINSGDK